MANTTLSALPCGRKMPLPRHASHIESRSQRKVENYAGWHVMVFQERSENHSYCYVYCLKNERPEIFQLRYDIATICAMSLVRRASPDYTSTFMGPMPLDLFSDRECFSKVLAYSKVTEAFRCK